MDNNFSRPYPFVCHSKYYLRQDHFPLAQSLNRKNGFMVVKNDEKPSNAFSLVSKSASMQDLPSISESFYANLNIAEHQPMSKPFLPKYVEFEKKVLFFTAYFVEPIFDSIVEIHRIHYVDIFYHLVDDTITVVEQKTDNSGAYQGKLFFRQKVTRNAMESAPTEHVHWKGIHVGGNVEMFSRQYTVVSCDSFTKQFFIDNGIPVNISDERPMDPFNYKQNMPLKQHSLVKSDKHFLNEKRTGVLNFSAVWDDPFGDHYNRVWRKFFIVSFFRHDQTFQLKQVDDAYSNVTKLFLQRQRLRKSSNNGTVEFYSETDLNLGKWLNVNGRSMLLYDCDNSTRNTLESKLNPTVDLTCFPVGHLPPIESVQAEPEKQLKVKSFIANLVDPDDYLKSIQYYIVEMNVDDCTVSVWEKVDKSNQFKGRPFVAPSKISLRQSKKFYDFFSLSAIKVGAIVHLFRWSFLLTDEISLKDV